MTPDARRAVPTVAFPNGYSAPLGLHPVNVSAYDAVSCATHMSPADGIMLIDEPEISLHVDWQRIILDEIMRQAGIAKSLRVPMPPRW